MKMTTPRASGRSRCGWRESRDSALRTIEEFAEGTIMEEEVIGRVNSGKPEVVLS